MRVVVVIAAAAALSLTVGGCMTTKTADGTVVPPLPANYRQAVINEVKKTFFDPYSIRDATIADPIHGVGILGEVATVCVRANAKNRLGGYTGLKTTGFLFRAGEIVMTMTDDLSPPACNAATYYPFFEIDSATPPLPPEPPAPSRARKPQTAAR